MKCVYNFLVKPKDNRTNSIKKIGDKELILNTDLQDHNFVSRFGVVIDVPTAIKTDIKPGDEVLLHHNVFRRFYDVRGKEKNSKSFIQDNVFSVQEDQIFMYKRDGEWKALDGYCFVKPIVENNMFTNEKEKIGVGIAKYVDDDLMCSGIQPEDVVGFRPGAEYQFIVNKEKLYRVKSKMITINYGRKTNQIEYNPSWLQSD